MLLFMYCNRVVAIVRDEKDLAKMKEICKNEGVTFLDIYEKKFPLYLMCLAVDDGFIMGNENEMPFNYRDALDFKVLLNENKKEGNL